VEEFRLETPEVVQVDYTPAGIGSRGLAAAIDYLAMIGMGIILTIVCVWLASFGAVVLAYILGLTGAFFIIFGYFIAYETIWRGQTPGKRALRIRVLKTSGYPIGFLDAVIRNLVRIVDFLPSFYGVGVVAMFISTQSRRLGDYAAGTVVVMERPPVRLSDLHAAAPAASAEPVAPLGSTDPDEYTWQLHRVTDRQEAVMREFLDRAPSLPPDVRTRIGGEVARRIAATIEAREPFDSVAFLKRVLELRHPPEAAYVPTQPPADLPTEPSRW
jgi:uncharacterized RDD family membrane protein YckC